MQDTEKMSSVCVSLAYKELMADARTTSGLAQIDWEQVKTHSTKLASLMSELNGKHAGPFPANQSADTGKCRHCGGENIFNPKTGKIFCKAKCWLNK